VATAPGGGVTDGDPAVRDRGVAGATTTMPATPEGRTSDERQQKHRMMDGGA